MAKRFQRELDEKGEGEEVDESTIDWLSETYKTKSQVAREEQDKAEREASEKEQDNNVSNAKHDNSGNKLDCLS